MPTARPYAESGAQKDGSTGVQEPLEAILDRCREDLILQALEILKDRHDAEDVVQETFVEAYRSREKLPTFDSAVGWLRHANRANALDRLRSRKRESRRIEAKQLLVPDTTFTTGGFSMFELKDAISKAMARLPEEKREIVRLRYWQHLGCRQIAEQLQMPEGSVKRVLFESNIMLFRELKLQIPVRQDEVDESPTAGQEPIK